ATCPRFPGELHPREIFAHANLQIRKRLVVLLQRVEFWLYILDETRFHQKRVYLAIALDELDVSNVLDQVGRTLFLAGHRCEITTCPITQTLRLADIDDHSLGIFHQIDTRGMRKRLDFIGRQLWIWIKRQRFRRHLISGALDGPILFYAGPSKRPELNPL